MNIDSNKKSIVTINKHLVEVGTHLYMQGGSFCEVVARDGDNIIVNEEGDSAHEWDSKHNLNDLQLGWDFARSDKWKSEEIKL